ncbi:hypothetical protein DPMN_064324 [Dreissena polymorpha]|uniref:Uncharacterized protein n=1 Tax=Dreissena polymorpha TaxID=45954 RepID=A0A9D4HM13_DREPO|nr:hypothetical protein DPMN_064324 [Dreissena polymorpha]
MSTGETEQIETLKQEALEKLTVGSNASGKSSRTSDSSSVAQWKRAKANAQRVKLQYTVHSRYLDNGYLDILDMSK